jgi:hypothetical protein
MVQSFSLSVAPADEATFDDGEEFAIPDSRKPSESTSVYGLFARTLEKEHGTVVKPEDLEQCMIAHGVAPVQAKKLAKHSVMMAENPHYD